MRRFESAREAVGGLVRRLEMQQIHLKLQNEELHERHLELAQLRERYSYSYDFAPVGYVTLDKEGTILEANLTAATMLGVNRENLLQSSFMEFVSPQSQGDYCLHRQAAFATGRKQTCDLAMHRRDKTSLTARLESIVFSADQDRQCRTALIDVTEQGRAADRLEQRTNQLRMLAHHLVIAAETERKRLAQLLHGHLQQILAAGKIQLDLALDDPPEPERSVALRSARDILEQATEAARSLSHELSPPVLQYGSLADAVEWQARWMESHAGLRSELVIQEDLPRIPCEVKILLFNALRELLFNIVKHANVSHCSVHLHSPQGRNVAMSVVDKGKGFDAGAVVVGFGLTSIRERVAAMGGTFAISSAPAKGSTIELSVPATPIAEINEGAPHGRDGDGTRWPSKRTRILVVEDHDIVRDGLVAMIRGNADMEVVGEASDGVEALELAEILKPDVVLMDVHMLRADGIEATRGFQQRQPTVRVVGLSVREDEALERRMLEAGAAALLPEHASSDILFATLRRVARGEGV